MTHAELLGSYVLPVLAAALTALAGFVGAQLKNLYRRWVDDKTKEAVVRTCVKAVEQLYRDVGGPEKLERAREGIRQMLEEKGIHITQLEMDMLIESVVSEFNQGLGGGEAIT
jgi:phosphoglycolate phosphatase-like HAD superfamily hydrolase